MHGFYTSFLKHDATLNDITWKDVTPKTNTALEHSWVRMSGSPHSGYSVEWCSCLRGQLKHRAQDHAGQPSWYLQSGTYSAYTHTLWPYTTTVILPSEALYIANTMLRSWLWFRSLRRSRSRRDGMESAQPMLWSLHKSMARLTMERCLFHDKRCGAVDNWRNCCIAGMYLVDELTNE